jgi:phosphomannomutase
MAPKFGTSGLRGLVTDLTPALVADHALDALVSTDGDGDRPLLADGEGRVVPGDILDQITAAAVGAEVVVTPVSSNSGFDLSGRFARVIRTKIGSPYVIAGMAAAGGRVGGYEANGGFLLGFAGAQAHPTIRRGAACGVGEVSQTLCSAISR